MATASSVSRITKLGDTSRAGEHCTHRSRRQFRLRHEVGMESLIRSNNHPFNNRLAYVFFDIVGEV